jgi:DNA-binding CsgD family transcriptional regulator
LPCAGAQVTLLDVEEIVGRDRELEAFDRWLDRPDGSVLLLEGEAGIGKTTLWRESVRRASDRGWLVLTCEPTRDEGRLAFAALADLLAPVLGDVLAQLPVPQRRALEIALLLRESDDEPLEEAAVAVALTSSLRTAASTQRVLLAADDVQWVDSPTGGALAYAMRRLQPEDAVAVLVARRIGSTPQSSALESVLQDEHLARLPLGPLSVGALSRLIRARLDRSLPRPLLVRIHEVSAGNPFYALELARSLDSDPESIAAAGPLRVPRTLSGLVATRLAGLPPETRSALETVAVLAEPSLAVLAKADGPDSVFALDAAVEADLVDVTGDRVRFTHPLLAAATVDELPPSRWRELHRRLASVVPSLEQRAHHLAIATDEADENVARELERAAVEVRRRGARTVAAELLDDAIRLTPSDHRPGLRARLLAASRAWRSAQDWGRAQRLATEALDLSNTRPERAEALLLLAECLQDPVELADTVLSEARDDPALEARIRTLVADRHVNVDVTVALENARLAVDAAERADDDTLLVQALTALGTSETVCCEGSPREHLERGIQLERTGATVPTQHSPRLALAVHLALRDEFDAARSLFEALLEETRAEGDESSEGHVLRQLARVEFRAGRWRLAAEYAQRSADLYEGSGDLIEFGAALFILALLAACRGDSAAVESNCRLAMTLTGDTQLSMRQKAMAVGLLELARGRFDEAASAFQSATGTSVEPGLLWMVPDRVEALIRAGRLDEAEELLSEWEDLGRRLDRPRVLATAARCRGLLLAERGEQEQALTMLERALVEHERLPAPFERARTLLALGTEQRRARQRRRARETLEHALAVFEELGAEPWSAKARAEIARIGGRVPSAGALTPSERRIAELVAEGKTNKEVASILVVADRTVESALTQIYRKLDVRSRTQLARKLAGAG